MGRPAFKLTDEQRKQVEPLAVSLTIEQMADYFGICRKTFIRMMARDPEIKSFYKKGKARAIANVGKNLYQLAMAGDKVCGMFYLKTQAGWRETQVIDHSSTDGSMIPPQSIKVKYVK